MSTTAAVQDRSPRWAERFFEVSIDLLATVGFDGYFRRVNPRWGEVLGYSDEELYAIPYLELVHPDDLAATVSEAERLAQGGEPGYFENRYRHKDGTFRWFRWSARTVAEESLHYCVVRDLTAIRATEEDLRRSEERYRTIVEIAQEGVWVIDAEGRTTFANARLGELLGCAPGAILGRRFFDFMDDEGRERAALALERRREGIAEQHEFRFVRTDGTALWALLATSPMVNEDGDFAGAVAMVSDITARKRAEEATSALNEELEARVEARTAELAATVKELESFAYTVSHDLRAPLRAMNGFARVLVDDHAAELSETAAHYVERIMANASRMATLVDDLLTFSRLSRQPLTESVVDVGAVVRQVVASMEEEQQGRSIILDVGPLLPCMGDDSLLRQVFANLLSNAVKFSSPRSPARITVRSARHGDEVVYSVADNGVGFDPQYSSKLFELFQRLHPATAFEGTGVGLAIVERIVTRHRGRVWGEGVVDGGATFFVALEGVRDAG